MPFSKTFTTRKNPIPRRPRSLPLFSRDRHRRVPTASAGTAERSGRAKRDPRQLAGFLPGQDNHQTAAVVSFSPEPRQPTLKYDITELQKTVILYRSRPNDNNDDDHHHNNNNNDCLIIVVEIKLVAMAVAPTELLIRRGRQITQKLWSIDRRTYRRTSARAQS